MAAKIPRRGGFWADIDEKVHDKARYREPWSSLGRRSRGIEHERPGPLLLELLPRVALGSSRRVGDVLRTNQRRIKIEQWILLAIRCAIPAILVAATAKPELVLAVAAIYVAVQLAESNLVVPLVMRNTVGLSPFIVLVAILVGATLGGMFGAFIAVPVAASVAKEDSNPEGAGHIGRRLSFIPG